MTRSGDRLAYTSAKVDRLRAWLARSSNACTELAERYTELHGRIAGGSPMGVSAPQPFGRPPLRLDVVDTLRAVETMTDHHTTLVRGLLRLGLRPGGPNDYRRTVRSLVWLSSALEAAYDADPETVRDAARDVWGWHARTGLSLGIVPRAFRVQEPCPECAGPTLMADPLTWTVSCVRAGCPFRAPVHDPVLVWSTG